MHTHFIRNHYAYGAISLDVLKIRIINGVINLLKHEALIEIELKGKIDKSQNSKWYIDEFVIHEITTNDPSGKIELKLTPTFRRTKRTFDRSIYNNERDYMKFHSRIEYKVRTASFGPNTCVVSMMDKSSEVTLLQGK